MSKNVNNDVIMNFFIKLLILFKEFDVEFKMYWDKLKVLFKDIVIIMNRLGYVSYRRKVYKKELCLKYIYF